MPFILVVSVCMWNGGIIIISEHVPQKGAPNSYVIHIDEGRYEMIDLDGVKEVRE